jgi:hypothetical protein
MVRNYLNNVAKGKEILPVVVFQGGVAANVGIRRALEEELGLEVAVPPHYGVMGAIGMALIARDWEAGTEAGGKRSEAGREARGQKSEVRRGEGKDPGPSDGFRGFELPDQDIRSRTIECENCPNACDVIEVRADGRPCAFLGDRCGRYSENATMNAER